MGQAKNGSLHCLYRGDNTRDFDLKLQIRSKSRVAGVIQYRSVTGRTHGTRPQSNGQAPYNLAFHDDRPQVGLLVPG